MSGDKPGSTGGADVDVTSSADTPQSALVPLSAAQLDDWMRQEQEANADPDGAAYARIIDQVLSATSPDIVLTPVEAVQAKDMVGVPLLLFGGTLNESEYDQGSPFYVTLETVVNEDQTPVVINCGHKKVIAQFVKLREFGQFPYQVMFRQRGVSKIGGTPMLELVKWETPEPPPF
jgi:hypothetical protein